MKRPKEIVPLNCIDKALLALHSKHDPMVFHFVVTIEDAIDPARLRSALKSVMSREPSLRSTVNTRPFGLVREVQGECDGEVLSVWDPASSQGIAASDETAIGAWYDRRLSEWMNVPLDPGRVLPFKVLLLRRTVSGFTLVFTFHHSAADGLRASRIIGDVIQAYNGNEDGSTPAPSLQCGNGDTLVEAARAWRRGVKHFYVRIGANAFHRFLVDPFGRRARMCRRKGGPRADIGFCQGSLSQHELKQIKARSRSVGSTVNDILLAACFRAVDQWNSAHGKASRNVSVMVPVDIGGATRSPQVTNQASFLSLWTTRSERSNPERLLDEVRLRMSRMLKDGIAFDVVYATHLFTHLPPVVPKAIARFLIATQTYLDTILLTNLGVIWPRERASTDGVKMGGADVSGIVAVAPVVSPMGISLCVDTYGDRLHVAMGYKTAQFSEVEARTFLNLYFHELRSYQRTAEGVLAPEVRYRETREAVPN